LQTANNITINQLLWVFVVVVVVHVCCLQNFTSFVAAGFGGNVVVAVVCKLQFSRAFLSFGGWHFVFVDSFANCRS
jgi:hypothetical protein